MLSKVAMEGDVLFVSTWLMKPWDKPVSSQICAIVMFLRLRIVRMVEPMFNGFHPIRIFVIQNIYS